MKMSPAYHRPSWVCRLDCGCSSEGRIRTPRGERRLEVEVVHIWCCGVPDKDGTALSARLNLQSRYYPTACRYNPSESSNKDG